MSAPRFPFFSLLGVLLSAVALMAASGINAVLVLVRLTEMNYSSTMVGLCMAAEVASVVLVSRYDFELDRFHALYGFSGIVAVAIVYSYRVQMRHRLYLLYGFGCLFIMGLGIRAMYIGSKSG